MLNDFNVGVDEVNISNFCCTYCLARVIEGPTCYKNLENPTLIDFILTESPLSFQNCHVKETRMVATVLKTSFEEIKSRALSYREYNNIDNNNTE